jgi:hypothetical protein
MAINAGQGTVLKFNTGSALTAIAQVVEIDGPEATVGTTPTVNLSSVSITKRALLPDGGKLSATVQYDPSDATHQFLHTKINQWPQTAFAGSVTFNDAGPGSATFNGLLTKFKPIGMNQEDNLEAEIEIDITGLVTWPIS